MGGAPGKFPGFPVGQSAPALATHILLISHRGEINLYLGVAHHSTIIP